MWISEEGQTAIAHADATLTFSNRRALEQLANEAVERGARTVVVDMGETGYVDTAALSMLVQLARRLRRRGGALCLADVTADRRAVLGATHLDASLPLWSPLHALAD
jgi:anti-anti-sigma factor